jgi:hypothetical protein
MLLYSKLWVAGFVFNETPPTKIQKISTLFALCVFYHCVSKLPNHLPNIPLLCFVGNFDEFDDNKLMTISQLLKKELCQILPQVEIARL